MNRKQLKEINLSNLHKLDCHHDGVKLSKSYKRSTRNVIDRINPGSRATIEAKAPGSEHSLNTSFSMDVRRPGL